MSAVTQLPFIAGTLSLGALAAGLATIPALRELAEHYVGAAATRQIWKLAAAAFALANFKNLPGVWHVRARVTTLIISLAILPPVGPDCTG